MGANGTSTLERLCQKLAIDISTEIVVNDLRCLDEPSADRVDLEKAASNLSKHGVCFDEAVSIFGDPLATTVTDPEHSVTEERYLTTGISSAGRVLIVWHTEREQALRIIGAREVTPMEHRIYESGE
jgi:uncharacterized DUF497 family protein